MAPRNPLKIKGLRRPPPRSILRSQPVFGEQSISSCQIFGNIVTTMYNGIICEIATKGGASRFVKKDRGMFAAKA